MFGLLDAHFGKLRSPGRFYNLSAKWSHGSPPLWLSGFGVEADWQHWNRCQGIWVFDAWVKYSKIVEIFGRSLEDFCTISWDYFSWIKPWFATHRQPIETLLSGYLRRRSIAAGTYTTPFLPLNGPRHVRTLTPCLQAVHEEITQRAVLGGHCYWRIVCLWPYLAQPAAKAASHTDSGGTHPYMLIDRRIDWASQLPPFPNKSWPLLHENPEKSRKVVA